MKLYNLPRYSFFYCNDDNTNEVFFFDRIDGMYSYCKDNKGNVCHFAAWTEVTEVKEHALDESSVIT